MDYRVEDAEGWGDFLRFRRDRVGFIGEVAARGVDIRRMKFGLRKVVQINHPDLIQDVLITNDWNFTKGPGLRSSKPLLGEGLLTSEGELHRRQRRLVQPAFHSARLAGYAEMMVACAERTSAGWVDGQSCEMHGEMMRLTLEVVGQTLFSADLRADAAGIGKSLGRALEAFNVINGPWAQLFSLVRRHARKMATTERRRLEAILDEVVDGHQREPERYNDMLSMLLEAHEGGGAGYMSRELLLDEALTLFLAGHETTANALTWGWYLLALHPEVRERMYAEVREALRGRTPVMEDLGRLRYTGQVFREVLRLYPPAWIIARQAVTGFSLGTVDVAAGTIVLMSAYATQRDARFWDRPLEFRPERWAEDNAQRPKFAFYPFGAGTRICIGEQFAMMEGVLILATLAQRWVAELEPGQTIEPLARITLRPAKGIQFRLRRC
jgi:cytochrome P450